MYARRAHLRKGAIRPNYYYYYLSLSVCLSVCLSVYPSVNLSTFRTPGNCSNRSDESVNAGATAEGEEL